MKRWIKFIISLLTLAFVMPALTGCIGESAASDTKKANLSLILGNTANTARASVLDLEDYIMNVCYTYGYLSTVIPDGDPYIFTEVEVPEPDKKLSQSKLKTRAKQYCKEILTLLDQAEAKTEEVDVLKAIQYGARSLQAQEDGDNYLIIFHSGLSTTGSVDFTKGYLETADMDSIVKKLKDASEIPSLEDVHVIWYNCGDVIEPQQELSSANQASLQDFWKTILEEAGAASVEFKADIPTNTNVINSLPYVTPVEVMTTKEEMQDTEYSYDSGQTLVFDEYSVQFQPNKAELLSDSDEFLSLVGNLISYMKEHQDYKILLCGTTARWGSKKSCQKLSEERANTIKELLNSAGVPKKQMVAVGLGYDNIFHINDLDSQGELVEEIAKKNRAVIILNYDSEKAKSIL